MNNIASLKLLNAIKGVTKSVKSDNLLFGTVKSTSPLKIEIKEGVVIPESNLFLGQMCRPYKVKIPHTHELNGNTEIAKTDISATTTGTVGPSPTPGVITVIDTGHKHDIKKQITEDVHKQGTDFEESVTIEIEPKLKNGDKVLMFAFNDFQMFYVAERLEEE